MSDEFVPIADAIRAIRQELNAAMLQGESDDLRFELGNVDLEFNAVVTKDVDGKAKVSFKLLGWGAEAEAGTKFSHEQTHKIKLTLSPTRIEQPGEAGKKVLISSKK